MIADLALSAGSVILLLGLIPTLRGDNRPETRTSATYALVLLMFAIVYVTKDLYITAFITGLTSSAWGTIYVNGRDKWKQDT